MGNARTFRAKALIECWKIHTANSMHDLEHLERSSVPEYCAVPICPSILPSLCPLDRSSLSDRVSRDHYRAANIYLIFVHQVRHLTCVLPHLTLTSSLEVGVTITSISQIRKSRLRKVK